MRTAAHSVAVPLLFFLVCSVEAAQEKRPPAQAQTGNTQREQVQKSKVPPANAKRVSFKVPAGKHGRLVASGARGERHDDSSLFGAVAPLPAETNDPAAYPCSTGWPVLYWYTSTPIQKRVDLVILERATGATLLEIELRHPIEAGLQQVEIRSLMKNTAIAGRYVWSIAMVSDPAARALDRIAWAEFEIRAPGTDSVTCWYDAFNEVQNTIESGNFDLPLLQRRHDLLAAIGLEAQR